MRRFRQQLKDQDCIAILNKNTSGVLALLSKDGYTYALPISYVYEESDNTVYFHSALSGKKLEDIEYHSKVSFCVIDQDQIVPEEFTTYFKSVIVFGTIHIIKNENKKREALYKLADKYSPEESSESVNHEIDTQINRTLIMTLKVETMTGKQAIELMKANQ